ncbi:MAG: hypothetical protein ACMUHX_03575 [bacterium]
MPKVVTDFSSTNWSKKQDISLLTITWRFLTIYVGVFIGILIIYREIFAHRKVREE